MLSAIFVTHYQPAKVKRPGEEMLGFPAKYIAPQRSTVLGLALPCSVGCNHFRAVVLHQFAVRPDTVLGIVAHQAFGPIGCDARFQRQFHQPNFSGRSTFCPQGDRKTMAVCNS